MLATLRMPNGVSVPMNSAIHAEHLDMRELSDDAHSFAGVVNSPVVQAWKYRVSFGGGVVHGVRVPAFDLGLAPPWPKSDPLPNAEGDRLIQRVPFDVTGWYAGCPVNGFAWSEDFVNWYGWESRDPWKSNDGMPMTPSHCMKTSELPRPPSGPGGDLNPGASQAATPSLDYEGCMASNPRDADLHLYGDARRQRRRRRRVAGRLVGLHRPGRARSSARDHERRRLRVLRMRHDQTRRQGDCDGHPAGLRGRRRRPGGVHVMTNALRRRIVVDHQRQTGRHDSRLPREQAVIGRMGGADEIPETYAELEAYVDAMAPRLGVNAQTLEFFDFLLEMPFGVPELGPLSRPAHRFQAQVGMGLMPSWARKLSGFDSSTFERRALHAPLLHAYARTLRWAYGGPPPFAALAFERVAADDGATRPRRGKLEPVAV